jgi:Fe-S-cluster containining protein
MPVQNIKTECDRCGTCCLKGGPALHYDDRALLERNLLLPAHLITIRRGEPVRSLAAVNASPAPAEIVKIKGKGSEWTCLFFHEEKSSCAIYQHRPLECSLLKCWDTGDLEKMAAENLLSRLDILASDDPILPFIQIHTQECSLENLAQLLGAAVGKKTGQQAVADLTEMVNIDLNIRARAYERFRFSLELELFFFGRPLFKILDQFSIRTHEANGRWCLTLPAASLPAAEADS